MCEHLSVTIHKNAVSCAAWSKGPSRWRNELAALQRAEQWRKEEKIGQAIRLRRVLLTQPGRCRRHLATIPNHAMHSLHSAEHTAAPRRAPGSMPKYCIADRILAVVVAHAPLILSVSPMEFELLTPVWHVERFVKHIRALHGSAERPPENGGFQHR